MSGLRAAMGALAVLFAGCAPLNFLYQSPPNPVPPVFASTPDGWKIALYRYAPTHVVASNDPVILCHGNALNNYFWHLEDPRDFGRYLQRRGFDVWLVDLRGHGASRLVNPFAGNYLGDQVAKHDPYNWSLEDYAMRDIDAVIGEVLKRTGKSRVNWIGHSMGGMIMYLRLGYAGDDRVANFIAVSSPMDVPRPPSDMIEEMATNPDANMQAVIEKRMMASILHNLAILKTVLMTPLDVLYYNRDCMPDETVIRFYANAVENIPPKVNDQLMAMSVKGHLMSVNGEIDYARLLSNVKTPILCVTGKADELAPPEAVRYAFNSVSSADKTFHVFSRASNCPRDYGHCDIICGMGADKDVYPYLCKWLISRSGRRAPPASRPASAPAPASRSAD